MYNYSGIFNFYFWDYIWTKYRFQSLKELYWPGIFALGSTSTTTWNRVGGK